jgi:ATP-dependent helicase/nuclease subunit B
MTERQPNLYTIPAGIGFAESLAAKLMQQYKELPEFLTETLILLPTRRSCRMVRDAFLRQSEGKAMLLPRLQTLGDIDEDALGLEIAALSDPEIKAFDIPPAISPLRRRIILTRLILARPDYQNSPDQALLLADALSHLLDKIYMESLDMAALPDLVDANAFSEHWQITLKFLTIISEIWPDILKEMGCIDTADRRNRLMDALSDHWSVAPPVYPIIAAGSTGSIPAAGRLLHVISTLPQGLVILPGLDQEMDEKSWRILGDTHPQATLKSLLDLMKTDRSKVKLWTDQIPARQKLASELMRPAETTEEWRNLRSDPDILQKMLQGLQRIDCPTAQEEARLISLIFRFVQHNSPQTAALITFDRNMARRVAACCERWGIAIDDSGGQPLANTPAGGYLRLCAQTCIEQLAPVPLLSLLKHKIASGVTFTTDFRSSVRFLDQALRGPRPAPGIAGLQARAPELQQFIADLETCLTPLLQLCDDQNHPFAAFLNGHIQAAENLAAGPSHLWAGEDGEALALFLSELCDFATGLPEIRAKDYLPMLETLMQGMSVRPNWGTHPRLSILGPLEARMLAADVVILGGLNEGSWPPATENDPWMSRPMRGKFGLPSPERAIGLSAHDFIQGFGAQTVILTRSERAGTAPTIPSRWLQRLDTVLQAADISLLRTDWLEKTRELDRAKTIKPISRPGPCPPVEKRPKKLSVTEIETWMRDPYALYARHVLSLKALETIDELPDAADKGTIIHEAVEKFIQQFPDQLPQDAWGALLQIGRTELETKIGDVRTRHFWGVRFDKSVEWMIPHEIEWRTKARTMKVEVQGEMTLPGHDFILKGKADRIDLLRDGSGVAIIDYKTGAAPAKKEINTGFSPQLPLEAAMVTAGAFPDIGQTQVGYLGHWILNGKAGGKEDIIKESAEILAKGAISGLQNLVSVFANENTPYLSIPRPASRPRYSDYTHLARVQEWSVLDETSDGGEG